jgi:hypothetical protein
MKCLITDIFSKGCRVYYFEFFHSCHEGKYPDAVNKISRLVSFVCPNAPYFLYITMSNVSLLIKEIQALL